MSHIYQVLSPMDWDMILKGAKSITVPKNGVIITQGEKYQRIYQINRGECRIEVSALSIYGKEDEEVTRD